eukprot:2663987-Amphidinium_carterae.1
MGLSPQVAPFVLTSSLDPESPEEIKRELTDQTIQVTVQKNDLLGESYPEGQGKERQPSLYRTPIPLSISRLCGCGNFESDTYGDTATNELDACLLRYVLSWAAGQPRPLDPHEASETYRNAIMSLDYTGTFLNALLPEGRVIVLTPPHVFVQLGIIPPGTFWQLHWAIYGLRESPALWGNTRDQGFKTVKISHGESTYRLLQTLSSESYSPIYGASY